MARKKLLTAAVAFGLLLGTLYFFQRLLMPKYVSSIVEGSLIEEYYLERSNHDVIFIGDCEVYESFSPVILWEEYGITSYIRGSPQQLIWQSYYLLEETLKYETPEVVIFNVLSMKYGEPQKEEYNRLTLDGMKMSASKIRSIKASMMEDEHVLDYIFPLLRYHSRWAELTKDDFKYMFKKDKLFHNGYYMRADIRPVKTIPTAKKLPVYEFSEKSYFYLDLMVEKCKEKNIELVLIKVPSLYPHWYDEWDMQIKEYAENHGLLYINFLEQTAQVGIDYNTDTYDGGLHLNVSGAEKMSSYLGRILCDRYQLPDHRGDEDLNSLWRDKAEFYYSMKMQQYKEIEEYGYLKSYGVSAP